MNRSWAHRQMPHLSSLLTLVKSQASSTFLHSSAVPLGTPRAIRLVAHLGRPAFGSGGKRSRLRRGELVDTDQYRLAV
jgi:hypothetical protein